MAITLGYTNWNGATSGGATITTVASTSGTTQASGSLLIALVSNLNTDLPVVTDNKGNTWTRAKTVDMFGFQETGLYYCINAAGGAGHIVTATWTNATNLGSIGFAEFKAVGAGTVDSNPTGFFNSSGNSPTAAPSITTTVANELVINGFATYSGGAQTITDSGAPWTVAVKYEAGTYQDGAIAYQIPASSSTSLFDTFAYSAFGYSGALAISFVPGASGGSAFASRKASAGGMTTMSGGMRASRGGILIPAERSIFIPGMTRRTPRHPTLSL